MKFFSSLVFLMGLGAGVMSADYTSITPFLEKYCVECHGQDVAEGEVRLHDPMSLSADLWIDIYDQLANDEMPPFEADVHPPVEELEAITKVIDQISRDERFTVATGYRRLNKREYRNTVRDLLGLDENKLFDPALYIYEDEIEKGFDTNSESLLITNDLLLEYLKSAQNSLRTALNNELTQPPKQQKHSYDKKQLTVQGQLSGSGSQGASVKTSNGYVSVRDAARAIPVSGNYRIKVTAAGKDRISNNAHTRPSNFPGKGSPFLISIGADFRGNSKVYQEFELKDDQMTTHQAVVWLDKGSNPRVVFANGHPKPRNINRRTPDKFKAPVPSLLVEKIEIEGPLNLEWPPRTYQVTYNTDELPDFENEKERRAILNNFISRSFRRNVTSREQEKYYQYLLKEYEKDQHWQNALIRTFAVILSSIDFLYIKEDLGKLNDFQLANRLSYFLWSTMPDMELFRLAASGDLLKPEVYRQQVNRLMQDPRAKNFCDSFASQWLSIDQLGEMRPDVDDKKYSFYYRDRLEEAMRDETLLFFEHVLFQNRPITDFLESDYTFLNEPLANLYGIPFESGGNRFAMKKVRLPRNSVRGGLLGQASIHAVTSNGVETLPVTRGHWVLDELMGTPPPPAPEEVPALVPDLTGVDTPRAQLDRHREDPKCFSCHQLMDPPGLALESFDIVGRYRTDYGNKKSRIDASGEFQGTAFKDVRGLRQALLKNEKIFAVNFIARIAEYGKGRKLNRNDMDLVKEIARKAEGNDYQFMSIMNEVLNSDLILRR